MKNYSELNVWIRSRHLVKLIYLVSVDFPKEELFGMTNQMRRAAISIPSNIAEGCGRSSTKDTLKFLFIARRSTYELETQCYLAFDLDFLDKQQFEMLSTQLEHVKKLLNGFINYYEKRGR